MTGDRQRDVAPRLREEIAARLAKLGADDSLRHQVLDVVPVDVEERRQQFGDELPVGLALAPGQTSEASETSPFGEQRREY